MPSADISAPIANGLSLLRNPLLNKGTAFSPAEREAFALTGLLPPVVSNIYEQVSRVLANLRGLPTDLEKYVALSALRDRNETLFLRLVCDHIDEIQPLIYTPTVGEACQAFGDIFQRPRGLYVTANDKGNIAQLLRNWPEKARLIVVTDGERILGLGDLGANGMGIPIGKLSLYSACAGIHPSLCLPVVIDVGTQNAALLNNPLYIGLRQNRLGGAEYDALLDEFVEAAQTVFHGVLIQFEDFGNRNAFRLLERFRHRCVFNDDIQGTAAVALAGLLSSLRVTGGRLAEQNILLYGAGEAAIGIADLAVAHMCAEGIREEDARSRLFLVDSKGLVTRGRNDLGAHKLRYAQDLPVIRDLPSIVRAVRPSALIGVSAAAGAFSPEVLRIMAELNDRPIIFALSNPTSRAECDAESAYLHTEGRALFACGSPNEPVTLGPYHFVPRQGNNSYVFPGIGLGILASGATQVSEEMFIVAARRLAELVTEEELGQGSLYPALTRIREVSAEIGTSVARVAYDQGITKQGRPDDIGEQVRQMMFIPSYHSYV